MSFRDFCKSGVAGTQEVSRAELIAADGTEDTSAFWSFPMIFLGQI